MSVMIGP